MIISGKQVQNVLKNYADQMKVNAKPTAKQDKPAGAALKNDEVILSADAQEFSQVLQAAKKIPDVRQDKVDVVMKQLEAGSYNVDAKDIAARMIERMIADKL